MSASPNGRAATTEDSKPRRTPLLDPAFTSEDAEYGKRHGTPLALIFYALASVLCVFMATATLVPEFIPLWKSRRFVGLADEDRPWGQLLDEPQVWFWVGSGVAGLVFSLVALAIVKARARANPVVTPVAALSWRRVYSIRLWLTDLMVVIWAVWGAQMIWFGAPMTTSVVVGDSHSISYRWISLTIVIGWIAALSVAGARDPLVYGEGTAEYGRVLTASFFWAGLVAIAATMLKLDMARGYILLAFPLGLIGLLLSRRLWRAWLVVKRTRQGLYAQRAVVVAASTEGAERILAELDRSPTAGYSVVAIALAQDANPSRRMLETGLPLVNAAEAIATMRALMADSLIVADGAILGAATVRNMSWDLEPGTEHLIVAPDLLDVSGPRVATRPVAGLNLMHVELPQFMGARAAVKRFVDVAVAGTGLIILAVPFGVIGAAIKISSKGPVFFRHQRIGLGGKPFEIWKFRSMVAGADRQEAELHAMRDAGNEVQFKLKDDPRVTGIGRWMRRFSVDELPQLFNVLTGSMSLVGPRPHVQAEVDQYTPDQKVRRLMVKPGITGLWQVSGRSDLSWEDSIRLDLYYVENWSILVDIQLLFRTIRAVFRNEGAY
jgi:exopolysaccharide biosynthesis polyprenyl glycosylphosphotransferase